MRHFALLYDEIWLPGDIAVDPEGNQWTAYACLSASGENTVFFKKDPGDIQGIYRPPGPLALWHRAPAVTPPR